MEQIQMYIDGERDYTFIKGSTGPLVYPGLHVYIYRILYALTGNGEDIKTAQIVFAGVYLISLYLVFRCYALAQVSRSCVALDKILTLNRPLPIYFRCW